MSKSLPPLEKPYSRGGSTICSKHDHLLASCPPELHPVIQAAKLDGLNMEAAIQRSQEECNNLEEALVDSAGTSDRLLARAVKLLELYRDARLAVSLDSQRYQSVQTQAAKDYYGARQLLTEITAERGRLAALKEKQ